MSIGPGGEFLVDGRSILVLSLNKFVGWEGGAWLRTGELTSRLSEAKGAGFNALAALNWWVPEVEDDWWYVLKAATPPDGTSIEQVVSESLSKPVLSFQFEHEFHGANGSLQDWLSKRDRAKRAGAKGLCGDLVMVLAGHQEPGAYDAFEHPVPELTISEFTPDSRISRIYDELTKQQTEWDYGNRFVRSLSITPVAEFASFIGNCSPGIPSTNEVWRAFLLGVAMNVKHFDVLWGANQNITGCTTVETLRPRIDRVWQDVLNVARWLRQNESLILDPQPWQRAAASPPLEPPSATTNWVWRGVYAAYKSGRAIVINMNDRQVNCHVELPFSPWRIDTTLEPNGYLVV